jgi:hypothetical protein
MEIIKLLLGILIIAAMLRTISLIWLENQDVLYKIKWTFLVIVFWFIAMPYYYMTKGKNIFRSN